jgi:hypothetical protein
MNEATTLHTRKLPGGSPCHTEIMLLERDR